MNETENGLDLLDQSLDAGSSLESTSLYMGTTVDRRKSYDNFVRCANQSLQWAAYFEEPVPHSRVESSRIRKCQINYFLEDDTISVMELKEANSGIAQGCLVRRNRLTHSDGSEITLDDIYVGAELLIYGQRYHVVDASNFTRRFLRREFDRNELPAIPYPTSDLERYQAQMQSITTTEGPSLKAYANAVVGNFVDNSSREGFLKYGNACLMFRCVWNDPRRPTSEMPRYKLLYHLADDTVEVNVAKTKSACREEFTKLLKRGRLPRNGVDFSDGHYHWKDLRVGDTINVYTRQITLVDTDNFTRQFYEARGVPLPQLVEEPAEPSTVRQKPREIPPYNGFGSEEDSLKSCFGHLGDNRSPKRKLGENRILCFTATLHPPTAENHTRRFLIQYFLVDNTIRIYEPPIRNSGFIGGNYLARTQIQDKRTGTVLQGSSLYIGGVVHACGNNFLLHDANDSTLSYMESHPLVYPQSDIHAVLRTLCEVVSPFVRNGELLKAFEELDPASSGFVDRDGLQHVVAQFGAKSGVVLTKQVRV